MKAKTLKDFEALHHPLAEASVVHTVLSPEVPKGATRFIVTSAQNGTPVHSGFWRNLLAACAFYDAHLIVLPLRYKNPTSKWSRSQEDKEVWAHETRPYLTNQRMQLNKNLAVIGDVKIVPTAGEPLGGFEGFTGTQSAIIGHTKLQFKTVPTPGAKMAKLMTTTGACTVKNYTDSRAGKSGEFHHTLGAVFVEIEGGLFWLRHLNADNLGSFTDLDTRFAKGTRWPAPPPEAVVLGDTHVEFTDRSVDAATFGARGLVTQLKPKRIVWHDLADGYSVNPHHEGNPFNKFAKLQSGLDNAEREVNNAIAFVKKRTPSFATSYIVGSNHDDFLRRWIIDTDWKDDLENAQFYMRSALAMLEGTRMGTGGTVYPSPFVHWVKQAKLDRVHCLDGDESLKICGIEMGMHGHIGPNGSRGSLMNLRRIGSKFIIGHSHAPGISEGGMQVGTSSRLRLEYNHGPSSWLHAHAIVHADGKRQLVILIDGRYRR